MARWFSCARHDNSRLDDDGFLAVMRIALGLEYDGAGFCGWQSQANGCGLQDSLEKALAGIADHPLRVIAAGRTDTGVHALSQVIHLSLIHISEPTRRTPISYAVFCLKKKTKK